PHPQITPIPNNEPDATPNLWNVRYVEIDSNFTDLNGRVEAAEGILENAKGSYENLPSAISSMDRRLVDVEASVLGVDAEAIARIKRATSLDWQYRYDRINFEFFAPDYTLIDRNPVAVVGGIKGDDSLDVASTAGMVADGYYVLSDATDTRLIRVKAVLSSQRLRLWDTLDRSWTAATGYVALTNYRIVAANQAEAAPGSIWLSKLINVGNRVGRAVIRRTDNAAVIRLYFRAEADGEWHEATGVKRSAGTDAVPAGFADYEYQLPVADNIYLRADCSGDSTVEIQHIVAFGLQYLDIINSRIDSLESGQNGLHDEWARHYASTRLDWLYRAERLNFEEFAPDYSLINKVPVGLREAAVVNDDTLDVTSITQFDIDDYYLLTDSSHGASVTGTQNTVLVKIRDIHTDGIITIHDRLSRRFGTDSVVCKSNLNVIGPGHAIGNDGEQWISKPIQISQETVGGSVFIRRTDNTAAIRLYWLDLTSGSPAWHESTGALSARGTKDNKDSVPAGFADYRYPVPAPGLCTIRIVIEDAPQWVGGVLTPNTRPISIQHIVVVGFTEHASALAQMDTKADKTTTYTKTEVDSRFSALSIPDLSGVYTKAQVDTSLGLKADKTTTYTKTEVEAAIAAAAPGSVDLSGYYTKTEVDAKLASSLVYKGIWDASASALPAASSANAGFFYSISASGNGLTVGDWLASNGHSWDILPSPTISSISGGTY
ncbi:MAG: hypothetical protein ACR2HF_05605, partial [Methylococcaceae bacterium]